VANATQFQLESKYVSIHIRMYICRCCRIHIIN